MLLELLASSEIAVRSPVVPADVWSECATSSADPDVVPPLRSAISVIPLGGVDCFVPLFP